VSCKYSACGLLGSMVTYVVEVVAGRDGYAVELVEVVGGGFDYVVGMAVELVEAAGGFGYAVEMVVKFHALASGGCPGCITTLRASLTPG
jgi:hypothetical protein